MVKQKKIYFDPCPFDLPFWSTHPNQILNSTASKLFLGITFSYR